MSNLTEKYIEFEKQHCAHNYKGLPCVFAKASRIYVWDVDGKQYIDFMSGFSTINQGHCHPEIVNALVEQANRCTLSSRAFYNDKLGEYSKLITGLTGYDMVLPSNTGVDGVETALKLARKWGYTKKGIPENQAIVIGCSNNFHGRTIGVIGMSTDPVCTTNYGPFVSNILSSNPTSREIITFGTDESIEELKRCFEEHGKNIAGFICEPIQGEAGIIVPDPNFFKKVRELCTQYNVLLIADEVQTGLCRTGKFLAIHNFDVRPDVVIIGKALGGGVYPVSGVLADKEIMLCIQPGEHGSTFGGNPLACSVAIASLNVLIKENLADNAFIRGNQFREKIRELSKKYSFIEEVRGYGLLNAIEFYSENDPKIGYNMAHIMLKNGLLTKPTHDVVLRMAPPLCITEEEMNNAIAIIEKSLEEYKENQTN